MNKVDLIAEAPKQDEGYKDAIASGEFATKFGIDDDNTFQRTRKLIKEAMNKYSLPFCSQTSGEYVRYFIITDEEVLKNKYDSLLGRQER